MPKNNKKKEVVETKKEVIGEKELDLKDFAKHGKEDLQPEADITNE